MTSVTNGSGLNFQNGVNPLGRKVRALESQVVTLTQEISALKALFGGKVPTQQVAAEVPASLNADLDALKKDVAAIKAAGFGKGEKGEKGDRGEKGDKGDKGDPGPMTYIAMPPNMMTAPTQAVTAATTVSA